MNGNTQDYKFFLLREYPDRTIEKTYHTQVEAFQACSHYMVNTVFEKRKSGKQLLMRVEWGIEYCSGEAEVFEGHSFSV